MKTLYYRRHSIKDGVNNTVGPKGLLLAVTEGSVDPNVLNYDRVFHGLLLRTAQTALAFFSSHSSSNPQPMPVVPEIGDDALFAKMVTEEFRTAVKSGRSNYEALFAAHPIEECRKWAELAFAGVKKMFEQMNNDETAIAFGHSPIIELAAWATYALNAEINQFDLSYTFLADLEGLIFIQDDNGIIRVGEKITVG